MLTLKFRQFKFLQGYVGRKSRTGFYVGVHTLVIYLDSVIFRTVPTDTGHRFLVSSSPGRSSTVRASSVYESGYTKGSHPYDKNNDQGHTVHPSITRDVCELPQCKKTLCVCPCQSGNLGYKEIVANWSSDQTDKLRTMVHKYLKIGALQLSAKEANVYDPLPGPRILFPPRISQINYISRVWLKPFMSK